MNGSYLRVESQLRILAYSIRKRRGNVLPHSALTIEARTIVSLVGFKLQTLGSAATRSAI